MVHQPIAPRVTMRKVAERCRVSVAAVSKALAANPGMCDLAPVTRDRIRAAARDMGYQTGPRTGPGRRLAVVVSSSAAPAAGVGGELHLAIAAAAAAAGGAATAFQAQGEDAALLRAIAGGGFAGVVVIEPVPTTLATALAGLRIPHLSINQRSEGADGCICCDDEAGAALGVDHLAARGFARIAYLQSGAHSRHSSLAARHQGYRRAMERLARRPLLLEMPVAEAARRLGRLRGRTGVLTYNASDGVWLKEALDQDGLAVPGRIGLVCFDDDERVRLLGMTCLRLPLARMGRLAVERIMERIEAWPAPTPARIESLPCELVVRRTT